MTSVKPDWTAFPPEELHAALLMGILFRDVRVELYREDWLGLRQSHLRVVSAVPPDGVSVTELADRLGMTKQGCGQFVTQLTALGHLRVDEQPGDRRVRRVHRTPRGAELVAAVNRRIAAVEAGWAERVGGERYAGFRSVLAELALDPGP